jgi:hypothetical protein
MECDAYAAIALARIICRTDASRSSFIQHCYQEALAIIEDEQAGRARPRASAVRSS